MAGKVAPTETAMMRHVATSLSISLRQSELQRWHKGCARYLPRRRGSIPSRVPSVARQELSRDNKEVSPGAVERTSPVSKDKSSRTRRGFGRRGFGRRAFSRPSEDELSTRRGDSSLVRGSSENFPFPFLLRGHCKSA